jgi:hypothetical protein
MLAKNVVKVDDVRTDDGDGLFVGGEKFAEDAGVSRW